MSEEAKALYCAVDGSKADAFRDASGEITVKCPTCGKTDTLQTAAGEAAKAILQAGFGSIRQSKTFTIKTSAPARWKFGEQ